MRVNFDLSKNHFRNSHCNVTFKWYPPRMVIQHALLGIVLALALGTPEQLGFLIPTHRSPFSAYSIRIYCLVAECTLYILKKSCVGVPRRYPST